MTTTDGFKPVVLPKYVADGVPFRHLVDLLIERNGIDWPEPNVALSLEELTRVADWYAETVSWLRPVRLCLSEPDLVEDGALRLRLQGWIRPGNAPLAVVEMDADDEGIVLGCPVVHFLDRRFCTVGVLLHELAHLWRPTIGDNMRHGDDFHRAHDDLKRCWYDGGLRALF